MIPVLLNDISLDIRKSLCLVFSNQALFGRNPFVKKEINSLFKIVFIVKSF